MFNTNLEEKSIETDSITWSIFPKTEATEQQILSESESGIQARKLPI